LGPEARKEENGVCESVMSSLGWVRRGAPEKNAFIVFYSPQIASVDSR